MFSGITALKTLTAMEKILLLMLRYDKHCYNIISRNKGPTMLAAYIVKSLGLKNRSFVYFNSYFQKSESLTYSGTWDT